MCPKCKDAEWIETANGSKRCDCLIRKIKVQKLGEKFADVDLNTCNPKNNVQKTVINTMLKNPHKSWYLHGNSGNGKTYIISGLYNLLFGYCNESVFTTDDQLRRELMAFVKDDTYTPIINSEKIRNRTVRRFYWDGINDGNREKLSDFVRDETYTLINEMYLAKGYLIITSNYPLETLSKPEMLGGQTCRRIKDMCEIRKL